MKSMISKTMMLVAIGTTLLSFSPNPGGEGFEIFLNNKVVMQRFGSSINTVNNLQLNAASINDQLSVKYYHCGRVGKNRTLTFKDGQNNVLKVFRFTDVSEPVVAMNVQVKEILNLKKGNNNTLRLFYSSSELPDGRMLVSILAGNKEAVQP